MKMRGTYTMRKLVTIITILVLCLFSGTLQPILASDDDYVRITDLEYKAEVVDEEGSNGKVIITERLTFDIHAEYEDNLFWELWRVLPESYTDGVVVDYKVNYVKQLFEDGSELLFGESPKLYWDDYDYIDTEGGLGPNKWYHSPGPYDDYYYFESLLFYVDGLYRETAVFEIQYEMNNASLRYNDASELYISLFSGEEIEYLQSVKAEILIPNDKMPREGNYDAYTYGTNSESFDFEESDSLNPGYHTFSFNLNQSDLQFKKYNQYIEFALITHGDDKHIFTQHASINSYYNDDMLERIRNAQADYEALPEKALNQKSAMLNMSMVVAGSLVAVTGLIYILMRRKYPRYQAAYSPDYFRDIPSELDANFARRLVFVKSSHKEDFGDGFSAVLLSLAYKDTLELEKINEGKDWTQSNTKIVLKSSPSSSTKPLSMIEDNYLQLIRRHAKDNEISLSNFQKKVSTDYQYTTNFMKTINNTLNRIGFDSGYFQSGNYKGPKTSLKVIAAIIAVLGLLTMIIGNISLIGTRLNLAYGSFFIIGGVALVCSLILLIVSRKFVLLTQLGEDEYAKWYGLYNFLNSETLMKERGVLDLVIWEQYLIYATAFGISDKVIKALKVRVKEEELQKSSLLFNPMFRSRSFYYNSSRSFQGATRSASYTARTGGHGGYGGGGRGGGGGGGGH